MSDINSLINKKNKIKIQDWDVTIERKPFRRSMSIHLSADKGIRVRAGMMVPMPLIEKFLLAKKDWIEKNLNKFEEHKKNSPKLSLKHAETIPFLGENKKIRFTITLLKNAFASIDDDYLNVHIPRNLWSQDCVDKEHPQYLKQLRELYKREAMKYILSRVQFWSEKMNLKPKEIKFREQRTRWGSCSAKGVINMNWRLIIFKPEIIDYVIVHELAHLEHLNHSKHFWAVVEKQLPNRKKIEKEFKKVERQAEILTAEIY